MGREEPEERGEHPRIEELPATILPPHEFEERAPSRAELYERILERFTRGSDRRYHVGPELARGGQGTIVQVWDDELERSLAMKVAHAGKNQPGDDTKTASRRLARFLDEARITGQLDHPGIVPVHELGIDHEGRVFFTMKLVKGRELSRVFDDVRAGRANWTKTRAVGVLLKVCEAMAYAHDKGVIHRDLKPGNVMVGDFGEVYVMDWGLARVLDRPSGGAEELLHSPGEDDEIESSDCAARTRAGAIMGTPVYMPPEQARGSREGMGPASDVYSLGAMLYELVAGIVPHVGVNESPTSLEVILRVIGESPTPILAHAPDASPELVAICEKAMARDPADRYASMLEFAEDLRAHLENRVVHAYESGVVAELKKRVARNRGVFTMSLATIGALVVGLVVALFLREQAERRREDVLKLSAMRMLEGLIAEAHALWPPTPDRIDDYENWLGRARELASVGYHEQVARLRALGRPVGESEWLERARNHPRSPELASLEGELAARSRAQELREGRRDLEPFTVAPERIALGWQPLNELAWFLVAPERTRFGGEREALELARESRKLAPAEKLADVDDTLAWTLFWNGLDADALAASERALAEADEARRAEFRRKLEELRGAVASVAGAEGRTLLASLETGRDALRNEIAPPIFPDEETGWWYGQLTTLVSEVEAFADPETGLIEGTSARWGPGIEWRLAFARAVRERTVDGVEARRRWREAIESVSDPLECPAYGGLELTPQLGLLPIGRDPESGLWELAHPLSGEIPERGADGALRVTEDSCIVLVLVPGGTMRMRFEAPSGTRETQPFRLDPFLLSKYELTQGQWWRITNTRPSYWKKGERYGSTIVDDRHPVESVSWNLCEEVLRRYDLALPTEAQWDYALRAGTDGAWFPGDLSTPEGKRILGRYANLADVSASKQPWPALEEGLAIGLDDGFLGSSPVDALLPGSFGLHGMLGNVREWCRDWSDAYYYEPRPGDGEREVLNRANKVTRGGCMSTGITLSGPGERSIAEPVSGWYYLGVRPARALRDE